LRQAQQSTRELGLNLAGAYFVVFLVEFPLSAYSVEKLAAEMNQG